MVRLSRSFAGQTRILALAWSPTPVFNCLVSTHSRITAGSPTRLKQALPEKQPEPSVSALKGTSQLSKTRVSGLVQGGPANSSNPVAPTLQGLVGKQFPTSPFW